MSYLPAITASGNAGFIKLSFIAGADPSLDPSKWQVNPSIDSIKTWMVKHGWHAESDPNDGSKATSVLTMFAIPFHSGPAGGFSQVPGDANSMGTFDGWTFLLWDPFSREGGPGGHGDVDPTNGALMIVGVPLGMSAEQTIDNFIAKFSITHYTLTVLTTAPDGTPTTLTVTANTAGPDLNDPQWDPAAANDAGPAPRGGGWYLFSTPNPVTNDTMRAWWYEDSNGNATVQIRFNGVNDTLSFPLAQMEFYLSCCPYQLTALVQPDQTALDGDSFNTNVFFIASCLFVPGTFAPSITSASFFTSGLFSSLFTNTNCYIQVNGVWKSGTWTSDSGDVVAVGFPLLDIGTSGVPAQTPAGKTIQQAPMVAITVADNTESRIAGCLWDAFIALMHNTRYQQVQCGSGDGFMCWIEDDSVGPLIEASVWIDDTLG